MRRRWRAWWPPLAVALCIAIVVVLCLLAGSSAGAVTPARTPGTGPRHEVPAAARYSRPPPMAVRLRLTRIGGHKNPIWRVVVADQRSKRDGRVIETVGHYNAQTEPSTIVLDEERIRDWLGRGAQPSDTVRKLLRTQGIS